MVAFNDFSSQFLQESYMNTLPDTLEDDHRKMLDDLFEWLIDPCLDFIGHHCKYIVSERLLLDSSICHVNVFYTAIAARLELHLKIKVFTIKLQTCLQTDMLDVFKLIAFVFS